MVYELVRATHYHFLGLRTDNLTHDLRQVGAGGRKDINYSLRCCDTVRLQPAAASNASIRIELMLTSH